MEFEKEVLHKAASNGSTKVAEAFSKFAGFEVRADVSNVETVSLQKSLNLIKSPEEESVVVYEELLSGMPGAAILMLSRKDAAVLVDLLTHQPVGTTVVLKDIDLSAIKETLNILSNSYVTALGESTELKLESGVRLGVPNMISSNKLNEIFDKLIIKDIENGDGAIVFDSMLTITEHKVQANLCILFNEELVELIKKEAN